MNTHTTHFNTTISGRPLSILLLTIYLVFPVMGQGAPQEHDHDHHSPHDEQAVHDHDDHEGHDHEGHNHDDHEGHDHDDHEGHDHTGHNHEDHGHAEHVEVSGDMNETSTPDDHAGHDHGEEEGIELSEDMIQKAGIQIRQAAKGSVVRVSTFPAEIKLNRDATAAVTPRFRSQVLAVFGEIGDEVKKGQKLATLNSLETMVSYTVSAPRDGVIISKDLAPGEIADVERVLFEVADLSSVWAEISIFPKYQHVLKKGSHVTFVAHDGHRAEGTIQYISPIASHETRTFTARSVLENAPEDFTPGIFVRARIPVQEVDARVSVPLDAVQNLDGEQVIFVPGEHGFIPTPVGIGVKDDVRVEILSGLEPGQAYVATGAFVLKSQMVIRGMDPHAGHGH